MPFNLWQRANKRTLLVITTAVMSMGNVVCLTADQLIVRVIAIFAVNVKTKTLHGTNQYIFRILPETVGGMDVFLMPTENILLHRNGRQNQRVNRAEHHHAGHAGDNPPPNRSARVLLL